MPREKKDPLSPRGKLEKKLADLTSSDTVDAINSSSMEELKERLKRLAVEEKDADDFLKNDPDIQDMKAQLKTMKESSTHVLKGVKLSRQLIAFRVAELGTSVATDQSEAQQSE